MILKFLMLFIMFWIIFNCLWNCLLMLLNCLLSMYWYNMLVIIWVIWNLGLNEIFLLEKVFILFFKFLDLFRMICLSLFLLEWVCDERNEWMIWWWIFSFGRMLFIIMFFFFFKKNFYGFFFCGCLENIFFCLIKLVMVVFILFIIKIFLFFIFI